MGKRPFTRFTCDVLTCENTEQVENARTPTGWGYITVASLRGRGEIGMWLCGDHFKVIDEWNYPVPPPRKIESDDDLLEGF